MNGTIKLIHSILDRQSHKVQGIVEIQNQIRLISARLVLMQNYFLELTIKLCLDHKTLVYSLSPEFCVETQFKSLSKSKTATKKTKTALTKNTTLTCCR